LKYVPKPATAKYLSIAHDPLYIQAIETGKLSKQEQTKLGLPWSETLIKRSFLAPNGTLLAAQLALQTWIAYHAAGGEHTMPIGILVRVFAYLMTLLTQPEH